MFTELNNMCDISGVSRLPGKTVLIEGSHGADSSFVLHHFVSMYLKSGYNLCFLALSQSFNHYSSVGTKLGVSLNEARDKGNLVFIEALKHLGEEILTYENGNDGTVPKSSKLLQFDNTTHGGLKNLYLSCKRHVNDLLTKHPDNPLLFVIDDVSMFTLLGFDAVDVIYFISYLRTLLSTCNGCLLVQTQCDTSGEDQVQGTSIQHISHQSECLITVEALSSGYCKDVHGQITVLSRWSEDKTTKRTMQYKIQEKSVTFFAVGMSAAVL